MSNIPSVFVGVSTDFLCLFSDPLVSVFSLLTLTWASSSSSSVNEGDNRKLFLPLDFPIPLCSFETVLILTSFLAGEPPGSDWLLSAVSTPDWLDSCEGMYPGEPDWEWGSSWVSASYGSLWVFVKEASCLDCLMASCKTMNEYENGYHG